jgi:hypothetical protein
MGIKEIARNPVSSQAYVVNKTLGLQFHPELDSVALEGWLTWGGTEEVSNDGQDPEAMMAQTIAEDAAARQRTYFLVDNFLKKVAKLI